MIHVTGECRIGEVCLFHDAIMEILKALLRVGSASFEMNRVGKNI